MTRIPSLNFNPHPPCSATRKTRSSTQYPPIELIRIQQTIQRDGLKTAAQSIQELALHRIAHDIRNKNPIAARMASLEERKAEIIDCLLNLSPMRKKELSRLVREENQKRSLANNLGLDSATTKQLEVSQKYLKAQQNYYKSEQRHKRGPGSKTEDFVNTTKLLKEALRATTQTLHPVSSDNASFAAQVSDDEISVSSASSDYERSLSSITSPSTSTPRSDPSEDPLKEFQRLRKFLRATRPIFAVLELAQQPPTERMESIFSSILNAFQRK